MSTQSRKRFPDKRKLARDLASAVMKREKVLPISLCKIIWRHLFHEPPEEAISNAAGEGKSYVRVQVLTPVGLDRDKQLGVVRELTDIFAAAASDPELASRTWVLITESPEGVRGIAGHVNTGADIVAAPGLSCRRPTNGETEGVGGTQRPPGDL